ECRNSGFPARTRNLQDSASYDTAVLGLQAQLAAVCGGGNTSNPRVFTHGETSADAPPHAIEGEAGRRRELARRSGRSELSVFAKDLEAAIPALRRYARALTRDAEIADDLVQDTLVRALRSQHLFHGGEVRSWLYTILTNLNRNRLRSLARRPQPAPLGE